MKNFLVILFIIVHLSSAFSQQCDCHKEYLWMKKTFEENDAGYPWLIKEKGYESYKYFCDSIEILSVNANNVLDCETLLSSWESFYREGHIGVAFLDQANTSDDSKLSEIEIIDKYSNAEKVDYNPDSYKQFNVHDSLQGIWTSNPYVIEFVKDTLNNDRAYVGFVLSSGLAQWQPKQVKFEIFKKNEELDACYYSFSHRKGISRVKKYGQNIIKIGPYLLTKELDYSNIEVDSLSFAIMNSDKCKIFDLSDQTLLLRIPTFEVSKKCQIDHVLKNNKKRIISHPNLIIDLRNNGGGGDRSWQNIIPFIYTKPITTYNDEFLSTPVNVKYFNYVNKNCSFFEHIFINMLIKSLEKHPDSFVNILEEQVSIKKLKRIYPYPQKVYIIVNGNCASSTEQFILAAKQSLKVNLYGQKTRGCLDVSNVAEAISPDSTLKINYCVSRTLRPVDQRIDGIGIQPDVVIPDSVSVFDWVKYVQNAIEKKE